jgi:hypothetical protein
MLPVSLCLLFGSLLILRLLSPDSSKMAQELVVRAFSIPIMTYVIGTSLFVLLNLLSGDRLWDAETWLRSCLFCGLPLATIVSWSSLRD